MDHTQDPYFDGIKQRVYSFIEKHPELDLDDLRVSIIDGVVALDGAVDAYWKKYQVGSAAEELSEGIQIENKIVVAPKQSFDDINVGIEVTHELKKNPEVNPQWIDVHVKNGVLTLTGVVPSKTAHREVVKSASVVGGVTEIKDLIYVRAANDQSH